MNRHALLSSIFALSIAVATSACQKEGAEGGKAPGASTPDAPLTIKPPLATDLAKYTEGLKGSGKLMARFDTTHGSITCELHEKQAPLTVTNFVGLARGLHPFVDPKTGNAEARPFYDGLIFHRVIPKFMIQGGDPRGNGKGGPGYRFAQEISPNLRHDKPGVLSMANAGPNTNGSQFFITEVPRPKLDGGYNIFGQCQNIDVVEKIARVEKRGSAPTTPVVMTKVEIFRGE